MESSLEGLNSKFELAWEIIDKFEVRVIEVIQSEEETKKEKQNEQKFWEMWHSKCKKNGYTRRRKEREVSKNYIFKDYMAESFPNLLKTNKLKFDKIQVG